MSFYKRQGLAILRIFLAFWLVSPMVPWSLALGKGYVEETLTGKIYWSEGLVAAKGLGVTSQNTVNLALAKAMAEKAAINNARNNLLEAVKLVRLDSDRTVGTLIVQNDKYKEEITALVQRASLLDIKYLPDSTVEVWVGLKLHGPLADFYLNRVLPRPPLEGGPKEEPPQKESPFVISGVIIDARGLGIKPALAPKLYDENGKEIWGISHMYKQVIAQKGMLVYFRDLSLAKTHPRAGETPYVTKAIKTLGAEKVDLVIPHADAQALMSAAETQAFLAQGRIIILSD